MCIIVCICEQLELSDVNVYRSTSQTRVSASQGTTPRTGTMSSRDLRAARAARSARSTSPAAKPRTSTPLKNGTNTAAPPLQTRSLQTFQMSSEEYLDSDGREAPRQHTLPSVSRKKSPRQPSTESRKSAVDDFHFEYDDYARLQGSEIMATAGGGTDDANNEDFVMYRRDNLSQDSYRVTDSRDSSVDRLEIRAKPADDDNNVDTEFIGGERPLDEVELIQKLRQEQQLQESREMQEEQNAAGDWNQPQQNDDVCAKDDERVVNGEDVNVVKAEWDLPESCLQTEVEKIISIETTRIVETVETTRVTPVTDAYRRQKRLSRENAVRVVDEDLTSYTETYGTEFAEVSGNEFAIPVSTEQGEIDQEQVRSFIVSVIDDAVKKTAREIEAAACDEETVIRESAELHLTATGTSDSVLTITDDTGSPAKEFIVSAEDESHDETLVTDVEFEFELEEDRELELSAQNSEDTAGSLITVVELAASDTKQDDDVVDEESHEPLDADTDDMRRTAGAQQSPVASPVMEVLGTATVPSDEGTEDVLSSDTCRDGVKPSAEADREAEEAEPGEMRTAVNQTLTSFVTEKKEPQDTAPVDSAEVCHGTVSESERLPDTTEDALPELAAETSEDIPYVLHKRHIVPAAESGTRFYATLPSRHHPSRSRSLSPEHKKPVTLTSEQKRAEMIKVKASLESMAAEMAARRSPQSPVGVVAPTKRVFEFVVCSRLPPRDSFSSRDDTLSPPDEPDITLILREKKISSPEKKIAHECETQSTNVSDATSVIEVAKKAVDSESQHARDLKERTSSLELTDFPTVEISTVHEDVLCDVKETGGEKRAEVGQLQTPEGLESESESEGKPVGDEAATPELEDELNRILSESELNAAAEDNASLASGVSGKFTDESPAVETGRSLEATSRTDVVVTGDAVECSASVSLLPPDAAGSETERQLIAPLSCIETDSRDAAVFIPAEAEVQPPASLQAPESHSLVAVDSSMNGVVMPSDSVDSEQNETDAAAACDAVIASVDAAQLAAVEQRLLQQLMDNDLAKPADNISSSSSHSLNDQLDAEVLRPRTTVPSAVDAACRLSESSVDGSTTTCGFSRNVHLLDWLEEQAQLRGVSVSPHSAEGVHPDAAISDEDDVEHAVFEDNLQDIFAALEAEVMANPFLVPVTPQTSDMCINAVTSERLSLEDDSSLGVLEASGGIVETTCEVDTGNKEVSVLSDEESKQISATGVTETEVNIRHSQLSLSISSEGDVIVEHVNDLADPLEVLEIESRTMPLQLQGSHPLCLSSDSDSMPDECREMETLQDVGDVLDRVDEGRRLSISDLEEDEQPLTAGVRPVPLAADTSSDSSVGPVCVDEEPDAFAAFDEADNSAGATEPRRSNSDDEGHSISSSSVVDSDPSAVGNFVEQVMLHRSAGLEILDADHQTTGRGAPAELVSFRRQLPATDDRDTAGSEYAVTPSCATDVSPTAAQEEQLRKVLRLPQGAADTAISDEDEVEHGIEDSLQDVFVALEAEVLAKRFSVPITPQCPLDIDQDSSGDDGEDSSAVVGETEHFEQETTSPELAEAAVTVAGDTAVDDTGEISAETDELVTVKGSSSQETADVNVQRCSSPADVVKPSDAATTVGDEDSAELVYGDIASESTSTTDRCSVKDARDGTFQSDATTRTDAQDNTADQETNSKEIDSEEVSAQSLAVLKETAAYDVADVTETKAVLATEKFEFDSKSPEVDIEDKRTSDETVTAETQGSDEVKVTGSCAMTSEQAVEGSCAENAELARTIVTEAATPRSASSNDGTEPGTSAEV